jgi:3-deoxy-manno-octulosonate cytidylyltransferase (CMP-KDO synthetase)
MQMKAIAVIPARFAATRFPGKLMQDLGGRTVIARTYANTLSTGLFSEVWVATDSEVIEREVAGMGGRVFMSRRNHESGSDRIAEAVASMDADIVVNVQGDEPFVPKEPLAGLLAAFEDASVRVASLMHRIHRHEDIANPHVVKVVTNRFGDALYFSRSPIPYDRDGGSGFVFHRHIGVYGFRRNTLLEFTEWPMGALEYTEKLEQLRYLENGVPIRMVETDFDAMGIDTPDDLVKARDRLSRT